MPRGRGIGWAFQSLTQGSAKRGFKAGRHAHLIKDGLGGCRAACFQYFRQRRHFSGNARARCANFGGIAARLHQGFSRRRACCFRFAKLRGAFGQGGFGQLGRG